MIIPNKDTKVSDFFQSLVIDFPTDNIPLVVSEDNWQIYANSLAQEDSFSNNGAPGPNGFDDKTKWMQAVFHSMASFS